MSVPNLPLENRLRQLAESCPDQFPDRNANYWNRYLALVGYLRTDVYPHINAGLACLSKSPGIYTDHGKDHFDEVVRYAGALIESTFEGGKKGALDPYDLYLLLSAIRLHDAGNIDGRENHEKRAFAILKRAGNAVCPDDDEASLIAQIAEAHGGKTDAGDKDTIGSLNESIGCGMITCRPQLVAALVRFADEICEHSSRASAHHLKSGTLPSQNQLFHLYAQAVKEATVHRNQKAFRMRLVFDHANLNSRFQTPLSTPENLDERFLLDDALDRIQKLDTERIYCNRYLPPELKTDRVEVKIDITLTQKAGSQSIAKTWKTKTFIIQERGYPSPNASWRNNLNELAGEKIANELRLELNQ